MNIAVITFWLCVHTRVQRGVQGGMHPDRLPSEDLPEDLKVLIFQRF